MILNRSHKQKIRLNVYLSWVVMQLLLKSKQILCIKQLNNLVIKQKIIYYRKLLLKEILDLIIKKEIIQIQEREWNQLYLNINISLKIRILQNKE